METSLPPPVPSAPNAAASAQQAILPSTLSPLEQTLAWGQGPDALGEIQPFPNPPEQLVAPQLSPQQQGLFRFMTDVNGATFMVKVSDGEVRSSPAANTSRAKMPAPPKFDGKLDSNIPSIEVWVRDAQRYATRMNAPVKEVLEVLTQGPARLNIDNMLRDPVTAGLSDTAFADKFVNYYMQQAQRQRTCKRVTSCTMVLCV
jgi:hypothetical protein